MKNTRIKCRKNHHQSQVGTPVVNVPNKPTEKHGILKVKNRLVGFFRRGEIKKLQQQSCPDQEGHQDSGHAAESPGQGESQSPFRDVAGPEVEDKRIQITAITLLVLPPPRNIPGNME